MSTPHPCPSCGANVESADRFCPACGRPANPLKAGPPGETPGDASMACPFCGQVNEAHAPTCSACGARIGVTGTAGVPAGVKAEAAKPVGILQSWKFTLGIAALLVIGLIVLVSMGRGPEPVKPDGDPHETHMMERIRELQARTDLNPDDAPALLELANLLYDVRFFDRAAAMYMRYLEIHPENVDARVDLGTSYFQMSFSADSSGGGDLNQKAETCFLEAIKQKPDHQLAHFNLGVIRLHKGDIPGANEWFRICVAIDPGTEAARRAQQLMSQHTQNSPS